MSWQALTLTTLIGGSSSMGAGTALSRAIGTIPTACYITSFALRVRINLGAGTSTYANYASGSFIRNPDWTWGISWVPTGSAIPNLATDQDNPLFIVTDYFSDSFIRNTINTAGSPTYQDLFGWVSERRGRCHLTTSPGGTAYIHVANNGAVTEVTQWDIHARVAYNLIN